MVDRQIACFCERTFEAPIPESADLRTEPEVERLILAGEFMVVSCPACGKRLAPEFPLRLSGVPLPSQPRPSPASPRETGTAARDHSCDILMVPEADRVAFTLGRLGYDIGNPARVAVGFPELAEKVLISRCGLDDRVIEMIKYYLLTGAGNGVDTAGELALLFRGWEGERLLFHIAGLREGEIGVTRLSRAFYQRIEADVEKRVTEEPFRDFCNPPWVSLRKAWVAVRDSRRSDSGMEEQR